MEASNQKRVLITPTTGAIPCSGEIELKATLEPPDNSIMISIDGAGQSAQQLGEVTLKFKPREEDCGKAKIEFTASAPGYVDAVAKITAVKVEIIGITPRIPIYRPPNQGGGNRAGAIRFRTTPDHSKVKLTISRVAGSSGRARFKDDKETIEVTSAGDTDVRFYGKENSDIKKNINIQILVGNVVGAETTISVRTWVAGFKRLAVTPDQGELVFNYSWWSESGTAQTPFLADLDAIVIIGEIVRYPVPLPNPPFLHPPDNPTVVTGLASAGSFIDRNSYRSFTAKPPYFAAPYSKLKNVAKQKLGFWDLVWKPGEKPTTASPREDAMEELKKYDITREILETPWRFKIEKDGKSSELPLP